MHSLTDYTHLPPLHFSDTAQKSLEEGEMLEAEMLERRAEKVSDSLLLGSFKDNTNNQGSALSSVMAAEE